MSRARLPTSTCRSTLLSACKRWYGVQQTYPCRCAQVLGAQCNSFFAQTHKQAWDSKVARVGQIYGSHASLRLQMDRAILAQFQRLPGMHSNFSGLDTLLGRDEEIGFEDYLNGACLHHSVAVVAAVELRCAHVSGPMCAARPEGYARETGHGHACYVAATFVAVSSTRILRDWNERLNCLFTQGHIAVPSRGDMLQGRIAVLDLMQHNAVRRSDAAAPHNDFQRDRQPEYHD